MVLDRKDYEREMYRILGDTETYKEITNNPMNIYKDKLIKLVEKGYEMHILNNKERLYLIPLAPRIPTIYFLPKVHKDPIHPPGRPIISGIDSITSRIGRYIDFFLQPLVEHFPCYLRDTSHTIQLLEKINI